jgi:hypothetical protein
VKDHLAHLAAWNNELLAVVSGRPAHEGLKVEAVTYANTGENEINAILHHRNQARPLPEVLKEFRQVHVATVERVTCLTEARLAGPYSSGDHADKRRLVDGIASNTYEHDLEHKVWIEAMGPAPVDHNPGSRA